ncbi:MAG: T9SS type A sorting domain-containing protein [Bacteroidales bacterium]|nr:T9SS type A sorting domain-containing protein [Bacteroidales bacterium]
MKKILFIVFVAIMVVPINIISQSLQLKYTCNVFGHYIGNGEIVEQNYADNKFKIYDVTNGNIKWEVPISDDYDYLYDDFSLYKDYNGNGVTDILVVNTKTSVQYGPVHIRAIDPSTKEILFSFEGAYTTTISSVTQFRSLLLADVDKDGNIELLVYQNDKIDIYATQIKNTTSINMDTLLPNTFQLKQNYPNPFNPTTVIEYSLDISGNSKIEIFDSIGRLIRTIDDGYRNAGNYKISFDGNNGSGIKLSSGVYYYRLVNNGNAQTKKMLLLK